MTQASHVNFDPLHIRHLSNDLSGPSIFSRPNLNIKNCKIKKVNHITFNFLLKQLPDNLI